MEITLIIVNDIMNLKSNKSPEIKDIACPHCQGILTVSIHCQSIPCSHCNKYVDVKSILFPPEEKAKVPVGTKILRCYKCGKEIFADKKAQAVACKYCYHHNDLSDYKIKSEIGKILETHGTLYLKKRGIIEISTIRVGDAIIQGKINGDLLAKGTVEILKHGEIYGKITCRKLIVNKGGIFIGKVHMLKSDEN